MHFYFLGESGIEYIFSPTVLSTYTPTQLKMYQFKTLFGSLKRNEEWRKILEHGPTTFIVHDASVRITEFHNPSIRTGYEKSTAIGTECRALNG